MMVLETVLAADREKDGLWAVLAWLSVLAYRSSGGAKKGNLGDKIAKFAPGGLLAFIEMQHETMRCSLECCRPTCEHFTMHFWP